MGAHRHEGATPRAEIIEVIKVEFTRGLGIADDVCRICTAYYDKDGTLLAENDPAPATTTIDPVSKLIDILRMRSHEYNLEELMYMFEMKFREASIEQMLNGINSKYDAAESEATP